MWKRINKNKQVCFRHGIVCFKRMVSVLRAYSTELNTNDMPKKTIDVLKKRYDTDEWTNISPKILSIVNTNLHLQKHHPLDLVRQRIVNYFYKNYKGRSETPIFSVFDNLSPVVTTSQNFDSLLIPKDHPSRSKRDCFYINRDHLLRAHTTAHQVELISMGLDNFLIVGEVYRRDEIDAKHYPVFHQMDGVRTFTSEQLFNSVKTNNGSLQLFEENRVDSDEKQGCHTLEAVKIVEHQLKTALLGVAEDLFGKDLKYRWVDQFFPFTHPSWELEIFYNDDWFEVCGCGIIKQQILSNAGTSDRIGWAFGLGLERLAMCLYNIPDIRLFWSSDTGFLNQFKVDDIYTPIKFKVTIYKLLCHLSHRHFLTQVIDHFSARERVPESCERYELLASQ